MAHSTATHLLAVRDNTAMSERYVAIGSRAIQYRDALDDRSLPRIDSSTLTPWTAPTSADLVDPRDARARTEREAHNA